jgi:hypothetical protein
MVHAEHATNASKQAKIGWQKLVFLPENVITFFKILTSVFTSK